VKYDGFRGLCYLERGRSRIISRHGNLMSRFARLGDQIAASLDVSDAILDGFMTCYAMCGHLPMWPST
jgi:ATP-dependent DNA ligase